MCQKVHENFYAMSSIKCRARYDILGVKPCKYIMRLHARVVYRSGESTTCMDTNANVCLFLQLQKSVCFSSLLLL